MYAIDNTLEHRFAVEKFGFNPKFTERQDK